MRNKNFDNFLRLRKRYPTFRYDGFDYYVEKGALTIHFHFSISGKYEFHPGLLLEAHSLLDYKRIPAAQLESIIFHIGMIEAISYWKTTCSPQFIIADYRLSAKQEKWFKKLFYNGLGEFLYINGIHVSEEEFIHFSYEGTTSLNPFVQDFDKDALIVPVGGGKDSIVSLELLKNHKKIFPLILNPREASIQSVKQSGIPYQNTIVVRRELDPLLLQLNQEGFLNGHTPFSALLAFISLLVGSLSNLSHIALSNESSANEPTHQESNANHQYSKSYEFENDFRNYVEDNILKGFNYFSFLRPLSEYQIAMLFAKQKHHFSTFRSCNAGSKENKWCGKCSKCLFTYIILSPFLEPDELENIFGHNLLDDPGLLPVFKELTGKTEAKPFECVGTIDEIHFALHHSKQQALTPLPFLLSRFESRQPSPLPVRHFTDNQHFLLPEYRKILLDALQNHRD